MWDDLVAWLQSPGGARVLQTAVVPAVAILVAGVLGALIGRAAVRSAIRRADRIEAAGAVAGLVEAARAMAEADAQGGDHRRGARLRTEADVRTRLLTLPGAGLAADWAATRTDALQQRATDGPVAADIDELRDRLISWVQRPARAKRLFAAAAPTKTKAAAEGGAEPAAGPRRHGATTAEPEVPALAVAVTEAPAAEAAAGDARGEGVPAWQRTRSGGRLQAERTRVRPVEAPTQESEPEETGTAPVQVPRTHRADPVPDTVPDADPAEAVRLEAHQQAKHARPIDETPAASGTAAAATPAKPGGPAPAWLDVYDDEAQVTQNLDLKTPPPVAAAAIRDRGTGDDLVPRS